MIITLTTSTVSLRKNIRHLSLITESISKAGHNIAQDWISAMTIHLNKPVLLLTKNSKVDKMLQGLADNNMVILKNYSEKTLNAIIEDFIDKKPCF